MNTDKQAKRMMREEVKPLYALACASDVIVMYCKEIHSFVGPSQLYLLMKRMKLDNNEVDTIKFVGQVPRVDIREYIEKRPNIRKVITDSYGPISLYWKAFDTVRDNLTSFVARSECNGLVDVYLQLSVYSSPQKYDDCDPHAVLSVEDTMKVVLRAARLGDRATVYLYSKYGNCTILCKDKLSDEFSIFPNHPPSSTVRVCVHKVCLINSIPSVAEDRYFRIFLKRSVIGENNRQVASGYRITKITDVCDSKACQYCFRHLYFK